MLLYGNGRENLELTPEDMRAALFSAMNKLGDRNRVLVLPPDQTRIHSQAGMLTRFAYEYYGDRLVDILPAIGTHSAMTDEQIGHMFGDIPRDLFRDHDWRNGRSTRACHGDATAGWNGWTERHPPPSAQLSCANFAGGSGRSDSGKLIDYPENNN